MVALRPRGLALCRYHQEMLPNVSPLGVLDIWDNIWVMPEGQEAGQQSQNSAQRLLCLGPIVEAVCMS